MGKQGPCCHCGISITPLWRNGPPEKPVLCNACGSRWRIKGTLVNYMPMHSGICGTKSDAKASQGKKTYQKCKDQRSSHKRKEPCDGGADFEYGVIMPNLYASKSFDDDASTRSSTGSGISYSESCIQNFGGASRHFSAHKPVWDFAVPSKRRRPMHRGRPSIVKLARLKSFLLEPTAVEDLEEDLLVEYKAPLMDAEIGLGGIFIRPCLSLQEHESEASSLIYEAKGYNYSKSLLQSSSTVENPVHGKNKVRQIQKIAIHLENNTLLDKVALESLLYGKHDVLHDRQSPLASVDLKDIVNFHSFSRLLTHGEQLELSRYLSSVDVWKTPERLKNLFSSPELGNALSCFQSLLSEGYFEMPSSPASHLFQELLFHTDLNASRWMDRYLKLKNAEGHSNTVKNVSPSLVSDATCGKNERVKPSCGKREEPSCGESVSIETAGAPTESSSRGNEKPYECVWEEETEVSDLLFEIPSCLSFQQPWNKPFNIQEISMGDNNTGARFSDESGVPPNSFPTPTGSGHVLPKGKKQM